MLSLLLAHKIVGSWKQRDDVIEARLSRARVRAPSKLPPVSQNLVAGTGPSPHSLGFLAKRAGGERCLTSPSFLLGGLPCARPASFCVNGMVLLRW